MRIRIRWLKKQPKLSVTAAGLALVAVIGVADYMANPAITFGVFYLVPVLIVATTAGKMRGLLVATIAASIWVTTDLLDPGPKPTLVIMVCNGLDRLAVLFVSALLASTVSDLNEELEHGIEQRTDELRTSEKRFRQLTESISEVFWMTDPSKSQMLHVSPAYEEIWGRTCASLYAAPTSWLDAIHPEDRERISQSAMTNQVSGQYDEEYRIVRPDGSKRWIHDRAFPITDDAGAVYRIAGIAEDITEHKLGEIKVATLAHAVEGTGELICITDLQDRFVFVNQAFQKTHGYSEAEILGKTPEILHSPRNPPSLLPEVLEQTRLGGWRGEVLDRRKDGTEFPVRLSTSLVKDQTGQVIGLMGVAQDITAQKLAEEELRWKTAFLEAQVNSSIDGILVVDRHGKKILQNQRLNELWKIPRHIADDPDDKNQLQWVASMTKNPEEFIEKVEYLYSHPEEISRDERELKDGTTLDRYSSPVIGKDGEYYGRIWTFRDITERKQVEATLQRQQAELRVLFDLIPAMIWFKDAKDRILRLNKRAAEIAGKTVEQIEGKPTIEIHPQDATKFYADDLEVIRSGVPKMGIVETLRNSEGEVLWIQTDRVPYCGTDGSVIGIVVVAQDITERKRAEESLRLLGTAVKQSKESIVITDSQLDLPGPRILFVNPAFTSMTGYTAAEVLGKTPRILQGPHTDKAVLRRLRGTLTRGEPFLGETINYRKDGTEYYVELHVTPIRDASGVTTHFVALQRDITERKLAEVKVATLAHAVESTDELICITDLQDHFIFVNRAFQKAYGYTEAEILGKTPEVLFSPRNPSSLIAEVFAQARLGGWRGEVLDRRKDGTDFPIRLSTSLVKARNGQVIGLMGVAQDITEHKLAVETLQESQQQLKNILDNTTAAIHMKDLAGRYILVNRYFESKFHVRREEIVGKTDSDLFTREQATAFQQNDLHVLAASAPLEFEEVAPHADGLHTYISIKFPLFDTQGVPYAVCGISTDITERKRLEKEILEISDREQARIGHDLHDDLCQRLVSIAFDSNLLEKKLRKKSLVEAADANNIAHLLDESITQARTLARVLYPVKLESDGLAAALKELAISVSNRPTLHCDVDCPGPVPIGDIAIATHLYRIAQEAVSNAARHAQASRIVIGLQMRDGEITLSVTDNGIGLPDDVNQRRGMGLHTMQYRARLIDGRLAIKRAESGGTSVTCRVQVRSL